MIQRDAPMIGFSSTAMGIFAPGGDNLSSDTMAYLVAGLFGAFFMLGGIYSRISSV